MLPEYFTNNVIFLTAVGVLTETPNVELTVNGSISSNSVIYDETGNSLEWNSVYTTVSAASAKWELGGGTLVDALTSDVDVGGIDAGDIFDLGTSFQEFAEALIIKVFYPTFTLPSVSVTSNLATNVESGTKSVTLTVNLNKGAITGKSVNNIWQPSLFQDYRSGDATKYTIFDIDNGTNVAYTSADAMIEDGANVFDISVDYNDGPQPLDSKNNNYLTPLTSGTLNKSLTINGRRKAFYGLDNNALNSVDIRNLSSSILNPVNGSTFTINIPTGTTNVVFAYPATLRDVTEVKYVEGLGSDVKNNFVKTLVDVNGLNNYTAIQYKVYNFTPTGVGGVSVPFSQDVTYIVTI